MSGVVIHRGNPRWFEIRGRRYEVRGGPGPDRANAGWSYEIECPNGESIDANLMSWEEVRQWAQDYIDFPAWGYPEDDSPITVRGLKRALAEAYEETV